MGMMSSLQDPEIDQGSLEEEWIQGRLNDDQHEVRMLQLSTRVWD